MCFSDILPMGDVVLLFNDCDFVGSNVSCYCVIVLSLCDVNWCEITASQEKCRLSLYLSLSALSIPLSLLLASLSPALSLYSSCFASSLLSPCCTLGADSWADPSLSLRSS